MENVAVLLMEKDPKTGFLINELGSYVIQYDANLIDRIYMVTQGQERVVHMYITSSGEFEDWEFNSILDNYNIELYSEKVRSIEEDEEGYNPTWLVKFNFADNDSLMEEKINEILKLHSSEMERVLKVIKHLENEYKE